MMKFLAAIAVALFYYSGSANAEYVKLSSDLTIHYEQAGNGEVSIIFIPGWMMSTEVFEHQIAHFRNSSEYRALTYDPRGQGRSSKTVEGHTYQQHGRDLAQFRGWFRQQNAALRQELAVTDDHGGA